jgi:mono/diheme cytochrome c family protein
MRLSPFLLVFAAASSLAQAPAPSRGQLLYGNHCGECHTQQMHWRTQRLVRDWDSLKGQVRRWQGEARLQWSEDDIDAVARHLNDTIYRLPLPPRAGR